MTIESRPFENPDRPYQVVTERLMTIEGREYVRCPLHGLIPLDHHCAKSPSDHWCRTAAHPAYDPTTGVDGLDDVGTSHEHWSGVQSAKLKIIADLHRQADPDAIGGVSGYCGECQIQWPCPTFHVAVGWGEMHDCWDAEWCSHAGVKVTDPFP